jgi:uncharacterized surface protein with fasciclin (FAS1) repeats
MKNYVRQTLTTAATAAFLVAVTSFPAFAAQPKWAQKSDESIVTLAIGASGTPLELDENGEDFDILVAALVTTGIVGIFDGTDYTVFAPNDQAFYDLTGSDNDTDALNAVIGLLGVDGIADVLAYHVTEGVRNSRSVTRAKAITMLDGNSTSGRTGMIEANFSTAGILNADNRVEDGIVHVIDAVLLPINPL